MSKGVLGTNVITQIAIIVNDIDKTSKAWADFLGIETPASFWTDGIEKAETEYKGKPCEARCRLAFFDMGSLQLELIQPDEHPSVWRDALEENGEGVHHIAFVIDGMKEKLEILQKNNMPTLQKGEYTGGRYAYVDAEKDLKVLLELLENDK